MKAVVFKNVGEIKLEEINDPVIKKPTDAIVKITTSAICGTDLHMIRGTMPGMQKGTVLGHEGVGIIEQIGDDIKNFKIGDRVIIASTIACGYCQYCLKEIYAQCDNANPNGKNNGTAFFGGPKATGAFNGLQAQKALIPFCDVGLVKIPDFLTDEQVILISDILPTAYMAVENANVDSSDSVAVFGCGPVGQLTIACLRKMGVNNIFAIDRIKSRLAKAQAQGAIPINFDQEDPIDKLRELTNNYGPSRIIDAVGIDADKPNGLINKIKNFFGDSKFKAQLKQIAPVINPNNGNWQPGNAPSQVLDWAIDGIAKAGTFSIIGVYPPTMQFAPIGRAMGKNLTLTMGNCNHRKYIPMLLDWVKDGDLDITQFITNIINFDDVINAYKHFDRRDEGWIKVILKMPKN